MESQYSSDSDDSRPILEGINISFDNPYPFELNPRDYFPQIRNLSLSYKTKLELKDLLKNPTVLQLHKLLFWLIFSVKFREDSTELLQEDFKKQLRENYVKLMVLKIQKKYDKGIEALPVFLGYSIYEEFWVVFKYSRHYLDMRFNLDVYKIIYKELLGITVTDTFTKQNAEWYISGCFAKHQKKTRPKTTTKNSRIPKEYKERIKNLHGGKELLKRLFSKKEPEKRANTQTDTRQENLNLDHSDIALQERIDKYSNESEIKNSFLDRDLEKKFNCVRLSPMIEGHVMTNQIPFKKRQLTPHKFHRIKNEAPPYVKLINQHCQQKRQYELSRMRAKSQGRYRQQESVKFDQRLVEISREGFPVFHPCFNEAKKKNSRLNTKKLVKSLFSNYHRYKS